MHDTDLTEYADGLLGGEDDFLRRIRLDAERRGLPTIQVPLELGRLLTLLVVQLRAKSILEIGTLFGYSTVIMARSMPAEGRLTSLEVNPVHASLARQNLEDARLDDRVEILQGPALQSLQGLHGHTFDLVFIDADKEGYPDYLTHALSLTRSGSVIVADNVWRRGEVTHPETADSSAAAMDRFNRMVAREPRLVSTIIPTRGGDDAAYLSVVR